MIDDPQTEPLFAHTWRLEGPPIDLPPDLPTDPPEQTDDDRETARTLFGGNGLTRLDGSTELARALFGADDSTPSNNDR